MMQPKLFSRLLSLLFFVLLSANTWGQLGFYNRDLPQLSYRLEWNPITLSYDSTYRFVADYDVNGRLIRRESETRDMGFWQKAFLREVRYVPFPDSMITTYSQRDGNNWRVYEIEIVTKDSDGRITSELEYNANSAPVGISLYFGTRYTYTLDANGRLASTMIDSYDNHLGAWQPFQWIQYQFTAGNTPESAFTSLYSLNGWQPLYLDINMQWHNFNLLKAKSYIRQRWTSSAYEDFERVDCTWGPYEYKRCTTERWENNAWVPYGRDKQLLDSQDHYTYLGYDGYDGPNWATNWWIRFRNTYSGGLLAESEAFSWGLDTTLATPLYKYVFFNYALSSAAPAQENPLLAFPQPAHDRVYVHNDLRGPVHLRAYDLQGRLLIDQASDAVRLSEKGLDLSQVPDGLYLLQITSSKSNHTLRIKVQH
jgi:YD repeat-containing protein